MVVFITALNLFHNILRSKAIRIVISLILIYIFGSRTPVRSHQLNPTERPKLLHNRCVIDVFDGVVELALCFFLFFF